MRGTTPSILALAAVVLSAVSFGEPGSQAAVTMVPPGPSGAAALGGDSEAVEW